MKTQYVLVGAEPELKPGQNPGGQMTASIGLLRFADDAGITVAVLNTLQPSFPVPSISERLRKGIGRCRKLLRLLRGGNVAGVIIFVSDGFSFFERALLSLFCRVYGVRDAFCVRSGFFMDRVESSLAARATARLLLKLPHRIVGQGSKWIDFYRGLGIAAERLVLVRNWLPDHVEMVEMAKVSPIGRPLQFLFVGWLVREKGVFEIVDAIAALRERYAFRFVFAGGGTLEKMLRDTVMARGWSADVTIAGWVGQETVRGLMEQSDVFVLPSYAEGFPNALLEGMACGLPAICTDVGGVSDSLQDNVNGFLIEPKSVQSLVQAMERYLVAPELISEHSRSALKILKENHDRERNCRKLFEVFAKGE